MPLENKGLALIREYENKKAVDSLESALCGTVGVLGSIGTFLYFTDFFRNGNTEGGLGLNFQPLWTPGYEINHDGVHNWQELAYLGGYIAATYVGVKAVRKVVQPIATAWREWRHESSGEKARDEEFNANYQTLAHRLLADEAVSSGLHQDYTDSLRLDLLTHHLTTSIDSGVGFYIALDLAPRRRELVSAMLKEYMMHRDYEPMTVANYKQFLKVQDLIDLGNHYVELGQLKEAENFISDHLQKFEPGENGPRVQFRIIGLRENIAEAFYKSGQLADAERVWKLTGNKEKLRTLSAAYRKAGDESSAVRVFAEHWR